MGILLLQFFVPDLQFQNLILALLQALLQLLQLLLHLLVTQQ